MDVSMPKPATPERESLAVSVVQLRTIITSEAPTLIERYTVSNDLPRPTQQFQANVSQAILASVALHWDAPKRKRFSKLRKEMSRVKKYASAAAEGLRRLQAALDDLTPLYRAVIFKRLDTPLRTALNLDALSARADVYATGFKSFEKGGAPKMLEFQMLVRGLASAFEEFTGRPAKTTWNQYRHEGDFVELVEAMLPLALTCSKRFGWAMSCSRSRRARGKYIYEMTRAGRAIPRTSYHIS
jgi:hypothetical protein